MRSRSGPIKENTKSFWIARRGAMNFEKKISELEPIFSHGRKRERSQWKEVRIIVTDAPHQLPHFEVLGLEGGVDAAALRVAQETVAILNHEAVVDETIKKMDGWAGRLTREEAEAKLKGAEPWTYLIREGDDEASMIEALKKMGPNIQPYFITLFEGGHKFSEYTILKVNQKWMRYDDETILSSYTYYDTPQEVIVTKIKAAKKPLQMKEV